MNITLIEMEPELKEKLELNPIPSFAQKKNEVKSPKMIPCAHEGCPHKTKRIYCCYHNPESIKKQQGYCLKYFKSDKGKQKILEANHRYQTKIRDTRNLFNELPLV